MRLPALMLLGATVLFWSMYDRHKTIGPSLLKSPGMADGINVRGNVSESGGRFKLEVPKGGIPARIDFPLPDAVMDYQLIRVRGRVKVDDVVRGKYPWNCARLLVVQYDEGNQWMPGHHGLVAEKGSRDWTAHKDEFEIFPGADRVVVSLQQIGTEGRAQFEDVEAFPVQIRSSFIWWRVLFFILWLSLAVLYFSRCRLHRRRLRGLIFLNAVAILVGTLMPGDWILSGAKQAQHVIQEFHTAEEAVTPAPAEKQVSRSPSHQKKMDGFMELKVEAHQAGHFVLFATLCFLVYLSAALERQHPIYFVKVGLDVLLFAAISESLQFLTIDRSAGLADLRIDLYGMIAALFMFLTVLPLVRRSQRKDVIVI